MENNNTHVPLRELVQQQNQQLLSMLQKQCEDSAKFREGVLIKLNSIETHASYTKNKVDDHDTDIKKMKDEENVRKGIIKGVSALGVIYLIDLFKRLFS